MSLRTEHLNYIYSAGTAYERQALCDISVEIPDGQFLALIGHTGSGKSTFIQHLNGLLKATSGVIYEDEKNIYEEGFDMRGLRSRVGLVFQYPEHQLFETDVLTDVMFGPKNQGIAMEEAKERAMEAILAVGLTDADAKKSPFELSGGQKRRAAIAGILAMRPKVLVLDEPTAGLDPKGRDEILNLTAQLHEQNRITVVLVSHSMEDVANYAQRIIVMNHGGILYDDKPGEVFTHLKELEEVGLSAPQVTYVLQALRQQGWDIGISEPTLPAARDAILDALQKARK